MPKVGNAPPVDRIPERLLRVGEVAKVCGLSVRSIWRLSDGGQMPRPLSIGGSRRWRETDLKSWLAAGCPTTAGGAAR